jgi:DNA-binding winged helix-turn-helix (wHTH) protein
MDLAKQPTGEALLTTAELAARADLTLGGVIVSPSTRTLRGPDGSIDVEPRVMQVLVVLADAAEQVVTRETLFNRCWGGVYVGDDSLNRAVAAVRRTVAIVGGRFEIETIPRTGYRLTIPQSDNDDNAARGQTGSGISRRNALIAGSALAGLGAAGLWWGVRSHSDARFNALMADVDDAMRKGTWDRRTAQLVDEAIAMRPESAKAWGLFALLKSGLVQPADPNDAPRALEDADAAARRSLSIDRREPNALLAMFELQGSTLDWKTRDQRLRQIVAIDPKNIPAISELVALLQSAGLNRESWQWNERAISLEPLSPTLLGRRALKLWIAGRVPEADKVIDQARALWPSHTWLWGVQFLILALSGRPRAAEAMRDTDPAAAGPPQSMEMWRSSLIALDQRSPGTIGAARDACFKGASIGAQLGGQAVMILSSLGETDAAFEIAEGFLVSRGSVVRRGKRPFKAELSDAGWRINTQWLFVPPTVAMRSDSRFLPLCEGVGLVDYWRSRKLRPDYQRV